MRLGAIPENLAEGLALATGVVPTPLFETMVAQLLARTVQTGVALGVFDALADGPLAAVDVAERCATHPAATAKLLDALAGCGYLRPEDATPPQTSDVAPDTVDAETDAPLRRYTLAPVARRWLLTGAKRSLHDAVLWQAMDAMFMAHTADYVRTGRPADLHERLRPEDWDLYQRAMRSGANLIAPELASRVPIPPGARDLLDIGGSHGHYAAALCRRRPRLRATILDLPPAVAAAEPLLAAEGLGERIRYRPGDALSDDLGEAAYDLVLVFNLVHHFTEAQNRDLLRRIARALRPGGYCVLGDILRADGPRADGQTGALTDLYFAVTSAGGTWSAAEMAGWQRAAGLVPRRPMRLFTLPGGGLCVAVKPKG